MKSFSLTTIAVATAVVASLTALSPAANAYPPKHHAMVVRHRRLHHAAVVRHRIVHHAAVVRHRIVHHILHKG